jgi:hypothetical protein
MEDVMLYNERKEGRKKGRKEERKKERKKGGTKNKAASTKEGN